MNLAFKAGKLLAELFQCQQQANGGAVNVTQTLAGHAHALVSDYSAAFLVVTAISLLAAPVCLQFPRNAGAEMSGQRRKGEAIEAEAAT